MSNYEKEYEFNVILAYLHLIGQITAPCVHNLDIKAQDLSFVFNDLAERLAKLQ